MIKLLLQTCILFFILSVQILFAQNGIVKSYYPDHKIKSELSYVNDILDGTAIWYHPNGKVMMEKNYSRGIINGWIREYFDNGQLKSEFNVTNGIKDGDEKKYYENGNLWEILSYTEGKLKNKQSFGSVSEQYVKTEKAVKSAIGITPAISKIDSSEKKVVLDQQIIKNIEPEIPKQQPIIEDVLTSPSILGGLVTIQEKMVYPEDALKFGLEGIVSLKAAIDQNGNAVRTEILKGLGLGCEAAAIKAVKQGKFISATKNGQAISSEIVIDLTFKLPVIKQEIKKEESKNNEVAKQIRKYEENLSVMCEADRCPRPEDDIATIYSLFQIPNVAKALKLRGMILIEGVVDKNGNLSHTIIIEGVGYGCDQLVEAALVKSKFSPGIKKGEPIETKALINFPFSYDR